MNKVAKIITDTILKRMEEAESKGEVFRWVKPFAEGAPDRAYSYDTKLPYKGINRLLLENSEYLTFNMIQGIIPNKTVLIIKSEKVQKVILYAITTLHLLLMKQQAMFLLMKKQARKCGEAFLNITVFSTEKMLYGRTTEKTYPQSLSSNTTHTKKRQSKCDRHLTVLIACLTFIAKNTA